MKELKIALIMEWHPFDEMAFNDMFREMEGIRVYPQLLSNYRFDYAGNGDKYDGYVFYNMSMYTPDPEEGFGGVGKATKDTIYKIGESGQGIVVLHHALLSHPEWNVWSELTDIEDRSFDYFGDVDLEVNVADHDHPITEGMEDWGLVDETFLLDSCGDRSKVLLSTENEKSIKSLAWVNEYKNSRVFVTSMGHDANAFTNPNYIKMVERAIKWTCKEL